MSLLQDALKRQQVADKEEPSFIELVRQRQSGAVAAPEDDRSQFRKGFSAGVDQLQAIGGGLTAAAGSATGLDGLKDWGNEVYEKNMAEAAESAGNVTDYRDIWVEGDARQSLDRATDYVLYGIGNLLPTMAPALLGGGVGGIAVRQAAGKFVAKRTAALVAGGMPKREAMIMAATEGAKQFAKKEALATTAGAFAGSAALETGSIYGDIRDKTGEEAPGTSALFGALAGAVEILPSMRILSRLGFGKQAKELAGKAAAEAAESLATFAGKQILAEGGTEVVQTILERAAVKTIDENLDIFTEEGRAEIINAGILGGLAGGVVGGGTAAVTRRQSKTTPKPRGGSDPKPAPRPDGTVPERDSYQFDTLEQVGAAVEDLSASPDRPYVFDGRRLNEEYRDEESPYVFDLETPPEVIAEAARNLDDASLKTPEPADYLADDFDPYELLESLDVDSQLGDDKGFWRGVRGAKLDLATAGKDEVGREIMDWWDGANRGDRYAFGTAFGMELDDDTLGSTFAYDDGNPDVPFRVRGGLKKVAQDGQLEKVWDGFAESIGVARKSPIGRLDGQKARDLAAAAGARVKVMSRDDVKSFLDAGARLEARLERGEFDSIEAMANEASKNPELRGDLYSIWYHTHDRRNKTDEMQTDPTSRNAIKVLRGLNPDIAELPDRNEQSQAEFDVRQEIAKRDAAIEEAEKKALDKELGTWRDENVDRIREMWDSGDAKTRRRILNAAGLGTNPKADSWITRPLVKMERDGKTVQGLPREAIVNMEYNLPGALGDLEANPEAFDDPMRNTQDEGGGVIGPRYPDRQTRIQELQAANQRRREAQEASAEAESEASLLEAIAGGFNPTSSKLKGRIEGLPNVYSNDDGTVQWNYDPLQRLWDVGRYDAEGNRIPDPVTGNEATYVTKEDLAATVQEKMAEAAQDPDEAAIQALAEEIAGKPSGAVDPDEAAIQALADEMAGTATREPQARPADEPRTGAPKPKADAPSDYGSKNTTVTKDELEAAKKRMMERMGRVRTGLDPDDFKDTIVIGLYHLEAGARKFADWVKVFWQELQAMSAEIAERVRPFLAKIYNTARGLNRTSDEVKAAMTPAAEVSQDVAESLIAPEAAIEAEPEATTLIDRMAESLDSITDSNSLRQVVADFYGIKRAQVTALQEKEGQEAFEAALVLKSREIAAENEGREAYDKLVALYENQPRLNMRTSGSMERQAYSTPAPLAWKVSQSIDVGPQHQVYEPTAGNGMLLIDAYPMNSTLNEIDPARVGQLRAAGWDATSNDATQYVPDTKAFDRVLMNPPFGAMKAPADYDGYQLTKVDQLIAAKALEGMKSDGKAVMIIGARKDGGIAKNELPFFYWLYRNYNVTDHYEVAGKLYERQGAAWPVRVITVEGRAQSRAKPPETVTRLNNWDEVYERQPEADNRGDEGGVGVDATGPDVPGTADVRAEDGQPVPPAPGEQAAQPDSEVGRPGGRDPERAPAAPRPASGAQQPGRRRDPVRVQPGGRGNTVDDQPGEAAEAPAERIEAAQGGEPGQLPGGDSGAPVEGDASQYQVEYTPRSSGHNEAVLVPASMAEAMSRALRNIEAEVGNLDEYVMNKLGYGSVAEVHNAFMALQVDAIASFIYNTEVRNKGIIIADQTGVGKGRQAAGIIRYAIENGKTPVFVTQSDNLFTDMYNDLVDIGYGDQIQPFLMNANTFIKQETKNDAGEVIGDQKAFKQLPSGAKYKAVLQEIIDNQALPEGSNALFMTYSQIDNASHGKREIAESLAGNAIFVLDESHNAAGQRARYDSKKKEMVKTRGGYFFDLIKDRPVAYLSATYAKRTDNYELYYRTAIMDSVDSVEQLTAAIKAGGLQMQTIFADMMATEGQLFRRERSFEGIEIRLETVDDDPVKYRNLSDQTVDGINAIIGADAAFHGWVDDMPKDVLEQLKPLATADDDVDITDASAAGNDAKKRVDHQRFNSVAHNYTRQLLFSLKGDAIIDRAVKAWKDRTPSEDPAYDASQGRKIMVAFENTMGSFIERYATLHGLKPGDPIHADYRDVLLFGLEGSRKISLTNSRGQKVKVAVPLEMMPASLAREYEIAEQTIRGLNLEDLAVSPVDYITQGMQSQGMKVDELTGRTLYIDYSEDTPILRRRPNVTKRDKVDAFNNDELDALVFNSAGATGLSAHASVKFPKSNMKPRHMIVAQPMQDINTLVQALGRINRTGQMKWPTYEVLALDVPAEKRPMAKTAKNLKSLNANTTASDESDIALDAPDMMNKYGDRVAFEYLKENPDVAALLEMTVDPDKNSGEDSITDHMEKMTGRMGYRLPAEIQEEIYVELEESYNALIEYLNSIGQNDLVKRTLDLDARIKESWAIYEGANPNSAFAGNTLLHKVDVQKQGKPPTAAEVKQEISENLDGKKTMPHMEELQRVQESYPDYVTKLEERIAADEANVQKVAADIEQERAKADFKTDEEIQKANDAWKSREDKARAQVEKARQHLAQYREQEKKTKEWMNSLRLGSSLDLDLGDGQQRFVVTNVTLKGNVAKGSPFAPSKVEVTMMTNSTMRRITMPLSRIQAIVEDMDSSPNIRALTDVDRMFDTEESASLSGRREDRYIATGNLVMGISELASGNTRPSLVAFTAHSGQTYQGILMPSNWKSEQAAAKTSSSNIPVRDPGVVLTMLKTGGKELEYEGGLFNREQSVRISPSSWSGKYKINLDASQAADRNVIKALVHDKGLQEATGSQFTKRGSSKSAFDMDLSDPGPAVDYLIEKYSMTFYALPSMRKMIVEAGGPEAQVPIKSFEPLQRDQEADPGDNVYFSRRQADGPGGVSAKVAEAEVDRFFRTLPGANDGLDIKVAGSTQEVWPGAQKAQAAYDPKSNTLYLFTDSLASAKDVQAALRHELLVHKGLGFFRQEDAAVLLKSIQENAPQSKTLKGLWARVQSEYADKSETVQAEELLARLAEVPLSGTDKFLTRIINAVRNFLRSVGLLSQDNLSARDLRGVIYDIAAAFQEGRAARLRANPVMYSRDPQAQALHEKLGLTPKESMTLDEGIHRLKDFGWGRWFEERVLDGLAGIKWAEESQGITDASRMGYVAARLATGVADVMNAVMRFGAPEWKNEILQYREGTEGLLDVLGDLGPELNDWLAWMAANRAETLFAQGRENNLTPEEIEAGKALAQGREELFNQVKERYNRINTALVDVAEGAGLINAEERLDWESEWYVPFYRVQDSQDIASAPRMYKGIAGQSSGIKRLKGSEKGTEDLLVNILTNYTKLLDASMKNHAMIKVVDNLAETDYISSETWRMRQQIIPRREVAKRIREDQYLRAQVAEMLGMDPNPAELSAQIMEISEEGFERMWALSFPKDPDVISIRREGRLEFYRIHDKPLLRAVTAFSVQGADQSVMRGLRSFKRLLTTGVTTSPDFMMRNFVRDAAHAWTINPDGFKFLKSSFDGLKGALAEDEAYRELMFAGAAFQGGYVHGTDPEASAQLIRRAISKYGIEGARADEYVKSLDLGGRMLQAWETYRELGDKVENANRTATFRSAKAAGKSDAQAVFEAKDLMDYSLRGNLHLTQFLVDTVPFLNARIQGLSKLVRAYRDDPSSNALQKVIVQKGAKIAFVSMAIAFMNEDDERYQSLPDWDKDANWHIWIGDSHIRVPKPFELGVVFGTIPERMYHNMAGSQPKDKIWWSLQHNLVSTFAINPLPQAVIPIIELAQNRSFFFDTPIENMGDQARLPQSAYNNNTSYVARLLSEGQSAFMDDGLSPKQIEHLWRGYLGTMGMYILGAADVVAETLAGEPTRPAIRVQDLPVVKSFYQGSGAPSRTQWTTDMYDRLREAQTIQATINDYIKNKGDPERAQALIEKHADKLKHRLPLARAQRRIAQLRKKSEMIQRSRQLTPDQKREKLDEIQTQINAIAKGSSFATAGDF